MFDFTLILRWGTFGIWFLWLFHYWGGIQGMKQHFQDAVVEANSRADQVLVLGLGLLTLMPVAMILLTTLGVMTVQPWAQTWQVMLVGTLLTLAGFLGGYYCRSYLGALWTPAVKVEADHHVVNTGPYGIVRHPNYTAMLTMFLGITIVFAASWTWLVYALLVVAYALKAYTEERLLTGSLSGYETYKQRVRYRIIPGLW